MHETTCCAPGVFQFLLPVGSDVPLQDGLLWKTWRIYLTHTPQPPLCKSACKSQRAARKIMLEHDLTIQTQHYQQENWIGLRGLKLPSIQHNPRVLLGPWVTGSQTSSRQKLSFNLLLLGKRDLVFVTFSESWFITGVKLKLDSPHCQADQSFTVICSDSQNTDFSALRGSVTDCNQFHVLERSIPFYVTSQKKLLSHFIFLLSYKNLPFVIPCPARRENGWRLTFLLVLAAPLSILLCVPLLSHPHLPSLAPAILMTPRQEAELAWESFSLFLCQSVLFVTVFHWLWSLEKSIMA